MMKRIALVTGGAGGIGTAICKRLADAGHTVVTNYRNEVKTREWQEQMRAQGYEFGIFKGDVSHTDEAEQMVSAIEAELGPVDILVNNAGITRDGTFHKMSPQQWHDVIDTNLNSCFNVTRPVIEGMRTRKWGRIIQISSINGLKGQYGQANYAAAKAGVLAMMRVLSREAARRGIRVNGVAPGVIDTSMAATIPESVREEMLKNVPLGRFGTVEEVATVILFLCSPLASYVTGQTIEINGGWRG